VVTYYNLPERRQPGFFLGGDFRLTDTKYLDERKSYTIDLARLLDGDTISGAPVWTLSGPTKISESNTTTTATILIEGCGIGELEITTTAGNIIILKLRWEAIDASTEDY
jgi:hypothetical protein